MTKLSVAENKGITGAHLKIIALICMTVDHIGHAFAMDLLLANTSLYALYYILRFIGRTAFPLYAFMIFEGSKYSRNIKKYFLLLGLFAVVSEIPFNLVGNGTWTDLSSQNVYFTLFLGLAACYVVRLLRENDKNIAWSIPVTALLCASAFILQTDYSWYGVLLIWLFAVTEKLPAYAKWLLPVIGLALIGRPWEILLHNASMTYVNNFCLQFIGSLSALFLIYRYNGERGNIHIHKYFFYAYYPAHLLLLFLLSSIL